MKPFNLQRPTKRTKLPRCCGAFAAAALAEAGAPPARAKAEEAVVRAASARSRMAVLRAAAEAHAEAGEMAHAAQSFEAALLLSPGLPTDTEGGDGDAGAAADARARAALHDMCAQALLALGSCFAAVRHVIA